MADRSWAITPELEGLIAKAEEHGGASDWTLSADTRTRAFLAEKNVCKVGFVFYAYFVVCNSHPAIHKLIPP